MSTTAEQMKKAKALIQQKKYEDARAILITVDHPKADVWLNRLNQISSTSPRTPTIIQQAPQDKSFTVQLFVVIVLLLFWIVPGVIALAIFAPEAKKYPNAPGAKSLIILNKFTFWFILLAGLALIIFIALPVLLY